MYTPSEGHIYANEPELGGLCRWAGDHFEPATREERHRLDGINHLTNKDIDHAEDGRSKHSFTLGPGDINDTFRIDVDHSFTLSLSDLAGKASLSSQIANDGQDYLSFDPVLERRAIW
jgi:hypothetical protein